MPLFSFVTMHMPLFSFVQDWSYIYEGSMEITIEVSQSKCPSSGTLNTYWVQNKVCFDAVPAYADLYTVEHNSSVLLWATV
jgi:hypothetical protein